MRTVLGGLVVVVLALGVAACGDDDDTGTPAATDSGDEARIVEVSASNFAFDPTAAEATAGAVHFEVTNDDDAKHTFTIDGTGVDIQLDAGSTGEADAELDAGEYDWRCTIHPTMTGTLTVT